MANPNQNARDHSGRYVPTITTAEKTARALELHRDGWTYQAIADELGYSHRSNVRKVIRAAVRDVIKGPAEQLLALHMDRLENLYEIAMEVAEADHVVVSHGKVVTMPDPETGEEKPLKDNGPTLAALREARTTLESFRKLVGLDAEQKINVSGGVRYEVVGINPEDLT
ncbi:helix-turn-helix domain-containing protein [Streptomyces aurantiogriseus]|uniref:Helix-turn-helix DNA binding domain protein n=1 Tax=Streptomyces aurantiogriseus TaxID=66870 RepID=A0A918FNU0_9ACTN|nr:helix-turn-helix domain-containing protein [Streptomyces aurantiogriseus]GGR61375.1 hypothetical protein GCM10010251_92710 [Streptomyces aurantiogriseus]